MVKKRDLKKEYLIFISYSSKDKFIGRQVSRLLEEYGKTLGVKTFLDEKDIEGGKSVTEVVRENLIKCDEFIVLLTPDSIKRDWIHQELGAAWGLRKVIVAFLNNISEDKVPYIIRNEKWYDLDDFEKYLPEMALRAKAKKEK